MEKLYIAEMTSQRDIKIGDAEDLKNFLEATKGGNIILTKGGIVNTSYMVCIYAKQYGNDSSSNIVKEIDEKIFRETAKDYIAIAKGQDVKKLN